MTKSKFRQYVRNRIAATLDTVASLASRSRHSRDVEVSEMRQETKEKMPSFSDVR